ncbi:MAG: aliphatic nitrilase [Rhodospirillaceae bacterium]|nr:aliphatic nitrilase [Rhodospirillaceae bacterium]
MKNVFNAAAAHIAPVYMDPLGTAKKAANWIEKARAQDIDLIVFPEVFIPGFPYWINCYPPLIQAELNRRYQDNSIEIGGPEIAVVQDAARKAKCVVVIGISERTVGGRTCYNSAVTINDDGEILCVHRKLMPTYAERYIWGMGDGSTLSVAESAIGRIGALVCWEHTMNLARQALAEQNLEIHAALWPGLSTMAGFDQIADIQIEAMMRNHALTAQCFVISAASPVTQTMVDFLNNELGVQEFVKEGGGWSAIIQPFAATIAGPHTGLDEKLVTAEIDLTQRNDAKLWVDTTGHYTRPDILSLNFDQRQKTSFKTIKNNNSIDTLDLQNSASDILTE